MDFDQRRIAKWRLGREERGLSPDDPFDGDPAEEIREECLDMANYAEQIHKEGRCSDEELTRVFAMVREIDDWAKRVERQSTG